MEGPLILDRYRPLADLASGGFADVVLAYDTRMQRRVAIKRLPFPRDRAGRPVIPAGLSEARTAAMLNHPSIVTVYEWDTDANEAFLIMEHVDGVSLADLLDDGPLDLNEAATVVATVAAALRFAHDNGVLHLDIKPENVLVTRDGLIKVTDFGVASLSTSSGHQPILGGTLGYMPLEQLRDEEVDERADVWAFASLVFESLTAANPLASDTLEGAIFKANVIDPPVLTEFDPALPSELDDVLIAALSTHAEDRYPDVRTFVAEILPFLGDVEDGRESLADAVAAIIGDGEDGAHPAAGLGVWDRLVHLRPQATRLLGTAVGGWLAYAGLTALQLGYPATLAGAALAALAGALAPGLGALLGYAIFLLALALTGDWLLAAALGISGGALWWTAGRHSAGFVGALAAPVLGAVYVALAVPLLFGFMMRPLRAAGFAAYAAAVTLVASAASGARGPYAWVDPRWLLDPFGPRGMDGGVRDLLGDPAFAVVVAAWALAAAVTSLACAIASRLAAICGVALGALTLYGGYTAASLVSTAYGRSITWSQEALLPHLMASLILVVLVVAAGPPTRAEEE